MKEDEGGLLELRGATASVLRASVVQYGYFRSGGYAPDSAGLAALGSFLFPTLGRFLLPLVALVVLLLTGEINGSAAVLGGLSPVPRRL